jgi:hypothetical protein
MLLLLDDARVDERERQEAIACYLSASEAGRRVQRLGGAFATGTKVKGK